MTNFQVFLSTDPLNIFVAVVNACLTQLSEDTVLVVAVPSLCLLGGHVTVRIIPGKHHSWSPRSFPLGVILTEINQVR